MTEETDPRAAQRKVWELVDAFQTGMLVVRGQGGHLSARPMTLRVRRPEGQICFLTETATEMVRCIERDPLVALTCADGNTYLSVSARAQISSNRALIDDLWSPAAQAFLPQGPADPSVCAIVLTPYAAEYWAGATALSSTFRLLAATLSGERPDLGDHGEVRL